MKCTITSLLSEYPDAFEDDKGTIWTSQKAAQDADWTYKHGDAFLENILGWGWINALENYDYCLRERRRKAFWKAHPRLRDTVWFLRCWYGALALFCGTVGRDWEGRISPSLAWTLASDLWLRGGRSKK
jgi:hypothetical protein